MSFVVGVFESVNLGGFHADFSCQCRLGHSRLRSQTVNLVTDENAFEFLDEIRFQCRLSFDKASVNNGNGIGRRPLRFYPIRRPPFYRIVQCVR